MQHICYWYDGDEFRLTRCTYNFGQVLNFPKQAGEENQNDIMFVAEFDDGFEPTFYDEAGREIGIENEFPVTSQSKPPV